MKLHASSNKNKDKLLHELYAVNPRAIWQTFIQESWAFKWLCIYFVFEYVRPASIYPAIDILPWTQLLLLFAILTAFYDKTLKFTFGFGGVLLVILLGIVLLSSLFSFRPALSWGKIDIVINWVLVYFLVVTVINSRRRLVVFLLLFLLINFKMSLHGFTSFASRGFSYTKWGVVGPPGWFGDSGDFGIAMVVFSAIVISFVIALKHQWGKYKKILFYFVVVTGLITIVGTSSRGAQLGVVAMGVWFLLKSKNGIKGLLVVLAVACLLYYVLPEEMFSEYKSAGHDGTSQDRLAHWSFGIDVIADHPVLGIGYENWLAYCNHINPYGLGQGHAERCRLPHNTYITAGAELGIPGLLVYIWISTYIFYINAKTRKRLVNINEPLLYNLTQGLDAGLIGYHVASIFFTVLFYPMLWVNLSLAVAIYNIAAQAEMHKHKTPVRL